MIDLLKALEAEAPVKRPANVEGWPEGVWVWRLDAEQITEMARKTAAGSEDGGFADNYERCLQLCKWSLGTEEKPGGLDNERGDAYLRRFPQQVVAVAKIVIELSEIGGASKEREKK